MKLQLTRNRSFVSFRLILIVNTTTLLMNLSQLRLVVPCEAATATATQPRLPPSQASAGAAKPQRVPISSGTPTTAAVSQDNQEAIMQNQSSAASRQNVALNQAAKPPPSSSNVARTADQWPRASSSGSTEEKQQHEHSRSSKLVAASTNIETSALVYLQKYGYMQAPANGAETNNLVSEESFSSAVADFQRFAGLPQTGNVDNQTLELMRTPRCGNSDKWRPAALAEARISGPIVVPSALTPTQTTISKSGQLNRRLVASLSRRLRDEEDEAGPLKRRRRRKRYALQGSKWRRQELTYRISQYPTRFSGKRHEVDAQIDKAFSIWSQVAPIDFVVKKEGRVHIDIRFASGDHGDGDAFDGPGNTLAHAYFPQYGGDAHFDDQEYWTIDSNAGTNIFQVAAHELGHSLGLGHSNVREALMAPFYQKYKPHFRLHVDDVLAIQALYGEKSLLVPDVPPLLSGQPPPAPPTTTPAAAATTTTTSTTTPSTPTSATSGPSSIDTRPAQAPPSTRHPIYKGGKRPTSAATTTTSSTTTVSPSAAVPSDENGGGDSRDDSNDGANDDKENGIPDLSTNGINGFGAGDEPVGPGSSHGPGVLAPGSSPADLCSDGALDAITRTEDGNTYAFKGDFYWLLVNEGLAKGYPRRIATDWEGLPGQLDAALTWADGKTFFFKGNKYWRFKNKRRDVGYPKLISAGFAGVPDDLDAAFVWSGNGRTYFFKGTEYWRFDSKADPPVSSEYPRSIKVWMGVPAHLNAAFKWENNVTYFFKGNQYYRFNDKEFRVESRGRPAFPRQTSEWWFGCVNSNLAQRALSGSLRHASETMATGSGAATLAVAAAQTSSGAAGGGGGTGEPSDWSFLAGLSEDSTRPMGTHVNDHRPPPPPPLPVSGARSEVEASLDSATNGPDELSGIPAAAAAADGALQPADRSESAPPGRRIAIGRQAPLFEPSSSSSKVGKRQSGSQVPPGLWNGAGSFLSSTNDILQKPASSSSSPSAILNLTAQHKQQHHHFGYHFMARLMIGSIVWLTTLATTLSPHVYHHRRLHYHHHHHHR